MYDLFRAQCLQNKIFDKPDMNAQLSRNKRLLIHVAVQTFCKKAVLKYCWASYTILPYGSALVQCIQQDVIKDLDITYDYSLYDMKGLKRKNPLAPSL